MQQDVLGDGDAGLKFRRKQADLHETIGVFAETLFRYAAAGHVAVRAFPDGGGTQPFRPDLWSSPAVADGLNSIVLAVVRLAEAAAEPEAKAVVCPPIA